MKKTNVLILFISVAIMIVGCSNKKSNVDDGNSNQRNVNNEYLKLGEISLVKSGAGDYEITPTNTEIFKERDGEEVPDDSEVFVLIDYTIKNVGKDSFLEKDILESYMSLAVKEGYLYDEVSSFLDYGFVDEIVGEIGPGETYESQFLFVIAESPQYILTHQSYRSDTDDTEWLFTVNKSK